MWLPATKGDLRRSFPPHRSGNFRLSNPVNASVSDVLLFSITGLEPCRIAFRCGIDASRVFHHAQPFSCDEQGRFP